MLNRNFIALLTLVAFALPTGSAAAASSSGAIVFSRVTQDSSVSMDLTGAPIAKEPEGGLYAARNGRLNQLTENPADSEPAFSADGRTIAFVRDGDVYAMRADGSGQRALTGGAEVDGRPIISPEGRLIVFERRAAAAGSPRDLYAIGVGGGRLRPLTGSPEDDHEASFSADGRTIVFVRSVALTPQGTADDLYSIRPSGVGLARLTRTAVIDELAPRHWLGGIAFDRGQSGDGPDAFADIYTMRRDGRRAKELIAGAGSSYIEDVAPGGRLILFRRDQGLWVKAFPVDGRSRRARKLIELPDGSQASAVFSSDGREVAAFIATESADEVRQTLTAISVGTGRQRSLAEGFASSYGTVTTTIGPVIAWQPVRPARH